MLLAGDGPKGTKNEIYTRRLLAMQTIWYKRFIDVQLPYRWNLRRLNPGLTLDVGCGIGRNLVNLEGRGVGIDHNEESVRIARGRSLKAFTPEEFCGSEFDAPETFDSLLLAHVAEHMRQSEVVDLLDEYLYLLKRGGKLIIFTPQEAGYRSDPTHVEFMDYAKIRDVIMRLGLSVVAEYSFPFPRMLGHLFLYNEFVSVSSKPR